MGWWSEIENNAISTQLKLELGLSLAIKLSFLLENLIRQFPSDFELLHLAYEALLTTFLPTAAMFGMRIIPSVLTN